MLCNICPMQGQPVLRSIDDCHYYFHWDTSALCPPHECLFAAETCEIVQDELNMRYNFKQAPFTEGGKIKVSFFSFFIFSSCSDHGIVSSRRLITSRARSRSTFADFIAKLSQIIRRIWSTCSSPMICPDVARKVSPNYFRI